MPQPRDTNDTTGGDESITMGVPHPLSEGGVRPDERPGSQSESEPEPTLVARPRPSGKGVSSGAQDGVGKGNGGMIDCPRSRAPSEPLFIPESDEEDTTGRADKGKQKEGVSSGRDGKPSCALQAMRSATIATSSTAGSTSTSVATLPHTPRSSSDIPGKPRSVQTILSTRDAAWNLRSGRGGDEEDERRPKRAKLSNENDHERTKKSFRSSLSQFLSTGKKALPDEEEEESEGESKSKSDEDRKRGVRERGDSSEVDELDEEYEGETCSGKSRKKRLRAGSGLSQVTMAIPSDDECAMDVDESPPTVAKPSRPVHVSPLTSSRGNPGRSEDAETISDDEWAFSSTLVGTYVPPAGKSVDPSPDSASVRPLAETDTDSVMLRVNLVSIGSYYLDVYNHLSSSSEPSSTPLVPTPSSSLRSAVSSANLETAAEDTVASAALSRIISKADFEHMVVVGQFNLGFIIVRKRSDTTSGGGGGRMDDLFIVDQHAADEKWNFETLQEKTVIASQRLFRCVLLLRSRGLVLTVFVGRNGYNSQPPTRCSRSRIWMC